MTEEDARQVLLVIRAWYNRLDFDDFCQTVFNKRGDLVRHTPGERSYYEEKFAKFKASPAMFFFSLDSELQDRWLKKMVEGSKFV